jgi:hypothetical protein
MPGAVKNRIVILYKGVIDSFSQKFFYKAVTKGRRFNHLDILKAMLKKKIYNRMYIFKSFNGINPYRNSYG